MPTPPAWMRDNYPGTPDDFQVKFLKGEDVIWASNPGPQTWFLLCPYNEILLGGARGGGKSDGLIAWMAMGDPQLPKDDPAYGSYLNEPSFRGLLLREEYQSMAEFVERAVDFYRQFGGTASGNPVTVKFKSGAKIYFNHLGDEEAFNKYKGWNLTKIGVEELTQVQTLRRYLKLFGSLRSVERVRGKRRLPKLRTQLAATTNPDGPGAMWVKPRFIEVYAKRSQLIPWNTPMRDTITGKTRIFIPARLSDNPFLRDDKDYLGNLLAQDEVTQAQWIRGDWNAGSGLFFREYRPDGPHGEEVEKMPWARHRPEIEPKLQPWWFRWLSCDYGYDHPSCIHKFCRNEEDGRIHVYDEMQVRQVGAYELGVMIAKWVLPELEVLPDHQMTLYLSPDAFNKTDATRTRAEQIESGIKEILGPYGALLMKYNDDERDAAMRNPQYAAAMFERRRQETEGMMCIAIKRANNDVDGGCSYFRELLRFRPVLTETQEELKKRLESVYSRSGIEAYEMELAKSKNRGQEVLPKLQIWRKCKELDRCLRVAIHDEPPRNERYRKFDAVDGVGGDDAIDCARYGIMAHKEIQSIVPKRYWVNERVTRVQQDHVAAFGEQITDPTRLAMIAQKQMALYDRQQANSGGGALTIPRLSARRVQ